MSRRTYTDEQKTEALELYREHGPAEAARRCDVPSATIRKWAQLAGITGEDPRTRHATTAASLSWEQRRRTLADDLGQAAAEFVAIARTRARGGKAPARDVQALLTAAAIGIDKAQLLAGGPTARLEHGDISDPKARLAVVHQLRDQAAKRASGEEATG